MGRGDGDVHDFVGDGAELRPLEPWQAEEFLAHMDRGRDYIGRHIGLADATAERYQDARHDTEVWSVLAPHWRAAHTHR